MKKKREVEKKQEKHRNRDESARCSEKTSLNWVNIQVNTENCNNRERGELSIQNFTFFFHNEIALLKAFYNLIFLLFFLLYFFFACSIHYRTRANSFKGKQKSSFLSLVHHFTRTVQKLLVFVFNGIIFNFHIYSKQLEKVLTFNFVSLIECWIISLLELLWGSCACWTCQLRRFASMVSHCT